MRIDSLSQKKPGTSPKIVDAGQSDIEDQLYRKSTTALVLIGRLCQAQRLKSVASRVSRLDSAYREFFQDR